MTDQQHPFVHLRVHSAYSLLEGALTIPHLVTLAAEQRMPALALTDTNNLFGALEFSESLAQARVQPIIGCTLSLSLAPETEAQPENGELRRHVNHGRVALPPKNAPRNPNLSNLPTRPYGYGRHTAKA